MKISAIPLKSGMKSRNRKPFTPIISFIESLAGTGLAVHEAGRDYTFEREPLRLSLNGGYNSFEVHYDSINIFANDETIVSEDFVWAEAGLEHLFRPRFRILYNLGFFKGYNHHRNVWLAEYFRQQAVIFNTVDPGSYHEPDPHGVSAGIGFRWYYLQNTGRMELVLGYLDETIAPAYEITGGIIEAGRSKLYTQSYRFQVEHVLHPRVRAQFTVNAVDTTDREKRYQFVTGTRIALGERWVAGLEGGYTTEDPQFRARFGSAFIDYEFRDDAFVFIRGRYYKDTGEIESNGFTIAAPGADSTRYGFGLRWDRGNWSYKTAYALVRQDYDPVLLGSEFFSDLYRDRELNSIQLVIAYRK